MVGEILQVILLAAILAVLVWLVIRSEKKARIRKAEERAAHRAALMEKYGGDEEVVNAIINKRVFVGETADMLVDSLGRPKKVDQQVLKTKTKEIWKYYQTAQNQFALRVTLENNVVTGWDVKNK